MAGLQRFISYIYKYENDIKMQNAGFAKVEIGAAYAGWKSISAISAWNRRK